MTDFNTHLPLTRIKKICKLDLKTRIISADALKLLTFATERYVQMFACESYNWARTQNRKTVQMKDIEKCIQKDWLFGILEDALTDWPESTVAEQDITNDPAEVQDEEVYEENLEVSEGNETEEEGVGDEEAEMDEGGDGEETAFHDVDFRSDGLELEDLAIADEDRPSTSRAPVVRDIEDF